MASHEQADAVKNGVSQTPIDKGQGDQTDAGSPDSSQKLPATTALMPVEKYAEYYNMNHQERSLALIFNHKEFQPHLQLPPRPGTDNDCNALEHTLDRLGFQPIVHHECNKDELMEIIDSAANQNHAERDCLLVVVLSHGKQGILYAMDSVYRPEDLWTPFAADKCPTLAGKPKLFFIQACQGDQLDAGITMLRRIETDSGSNSYKIPVHSDFLIAYSTIPGFYSWRNRSTGSWFVQALCQELNDKGFNRDLLTILTFVIRRVAIDCESNNPEEINLNQKKEIPCFTSMLTRLIQFTKK